MTKPRGSIGAKRIRQALVGIARTWVNFQFLPLIQSFDGCETTWRFRHTRGGSLRSYGNFWWRRRIWIVGGQKIAGLQSWPARRGIQIGGALTVSRERSSKLHSSGLPRFRVSAVCAGRRRSRARTEAGPFPLRRGCGPRWGSSSGETGSWVRGVVTHAILPLSGTIDKGVSADARRCAWQQAMVLRLSGGGILGSATWIPAFAANGFTVRACVGGTGADWLMSGAKCGIQHGW